VIYGFANKMKADPAIFWRSQLEPVARSKFGINFCLQIVIHFAQDVYNKGCLKSRSLSSIIAESDSSR